MFDAFNVKSVIGFLSGLKFPCDISGIHEGVAVSLFHFFKNGLSAAELNERLYLKPASPSNTLRSKKGMMRTYQKMASYLLHTYATDDVIADTDDTLTCYIQPWTMSPLQYAEALVSKLLRCGEV